LDPFEGRLKFNGARLSGSSVSVCAGRQFQVLREIDELDGELNGNMSYLSVLGKTGTCLGIRWNNVPVRGLSLVLSSTTIGVHILERKRSMASRNHAFHFVGT